MNVLPAVRRFQARGALVLSLLLVSSVATAQSVTVRAARTIAGVAGGAAASGIAIARDATTPEASALLIAAGTSGVYLARLDGSAPVQYSALASSDVTWIESVALASVTGGLVAYAQPSAQTVTLRRADLGTGGASTPEHTVDVGVAADHLAFAEGPGGVLWLFGASNGGLLVQWEVAFDGTDFALTEVRSGSFVGSVRGFALDRVTGIRYLTEEATGLYAGPYPSDALPTLLVSSQGQVLPTIVRGVAVDARTPGLLFVGGGSLGTITLLDRSAPQTTQALTVGVRPEGTSSTPALVDDLDFEHRFVGDRFPNGVLVMATGASDPWAHVLDWRDVANAFDPPLNLDNGGTGGGTDGGTDGGSDAGTDGGTDAGVDGGNGGGSSRPPGGSIPHQPPPETGCSAGAPVGALLGLGLLGLLLRRRAREE